MIDVVERPPKYNGAFRRPLKLMAVYNLRNQQAVTCNTGIYTRMAQRECVLCMCLILTYLPRKPFYFSPSWGSLSPRSLPRSRRSREDDDDSGGRRRQCRLFNSPHPHFPLVLHTLVHHRPGPSRFLHSIRAPPVALIKIPSPASCRSCITPPPNRDVAEI